MKKTHKGKTRTDKSGGRGRDEFTNTTKRLLAGRAGHRCSKPGCPNVTIGPQQGGSGLINLGNAAHITAAGKLGPRRDDMLTPEQRRHPDNGIWLCVQHANHVDQDDAHFTIEMLRNWKTEAEARAGRALEPAGHLALELDDEDRALIASLRLAGGDDHEAVLARLVGGARRDLEAHAAVAGARRPIPLALRDKDHNIPLDIQQLGAAMARAEQVAVIAPPGTGKSTTLLQLGQRVLDGGEMLAVLVPLGVWAAEASDLLDHIASLDAFRGMRREHFMLLAHFGRLALLLDGWNEVGIDGRRKAIAALVSLRRQYPLIGIALSTRSAEDAPEHDRSIAIEPLSEAQQLLIAQRTLGDRGVMLLDRAWRTPGLREMIMIPLYLDVWLRHQERTSLPPTREALIGLMAEEPERTPLRRDELRRVLDRFHRCYLAALAVAGVTSGQSGIDIAPARRLVAGVADGLIAERQIAQAPAPNAVLDVLIDQHVLVREGRGETSLLRFPHQQLQEWFASFEVERVLLASIAGDATAWDRLRVDIIDREAWEEPILFACQRLAHGSATETVARLIHETLTIDPILAAAIIHETTEAVWALVRAAVLDLIERWHVPGRIDRAVRFMVTSGRPEFAEEMWRLLTHGDRNTYLEATRAGRRFRPSVLGPDAARRLSSLPDGCRHEVVGEIAINGGSEGIALAVEVARTETNPEELKEIVGALHFRRADRRIVELLATASEAVWERLADCGYGSELAGEAVGARLAAIRAHQLESKPDWIGRLTVLAVAAPTTEALAAIRAAVESPALDAKSEAGYQAIRMAFGKVPDAVATGLLTRIERGLTLPFRCEEMLESVEEHDDGPLVTLVLEESTEAERATAAARTVGRRTVALLIARLLKLDAQLDRNAPEALRDRYWRLRGLISKTRVSAFLMGLLTHADTADLSRQAALCGLFAAHGGELADAPSVFDDAARDLFIGHLARWLASAPTAGEATRAKWSELARAAARLGAAELAAPLFGLLQADLERRRLQIEALRVARQQGQDGPAEASHSYVLQYGAAFAAIGSEAVVAMMEGMLADPEFGIEAALVLRRIWTRRTGEQPAGIGKGTLASSPSYVGVAEARNRRRSGENQATPLAAALFLTIEELCRGSDPAGHRRALELAIIALSMPHSGRDAIIAALMALPVPLRHKRGLLLARVLSGEVITAETAMAGLDDLLAAAQKETWLLDNRSPHVDEWLELLVFSDRPMAVMDGLARLTGRMEPATWRLRRLLLALNHVPSEAEEILFALAERDPRMLETYEWTQALLRLGTETAIIGLTERLLKGGSRSGSLAGLGRELANAAGTRPAFRRWLMARYRQVDDEGARQLETILIEVPDEEVIRVMIERYAASGRRFDDNLRHAIEQVVLKQLPSLDWPGAYELVGEEVGPLRKALFAMLVDDGARAELAERCLTVIDRLRDEHGRPLGEPRHPDIATGRPWPRLPARSASTEHAAEL